MSNKSATTQCGLNPLGKTKIFSALPVGSLENILFIKLL